MRIYGLNFEGCDITDGATGTGLDINKIETFLNNWKGPKLTIGIVMFKGINPSAYIPVCALIRQKGHNVLLRVCDSADMADYSLREYEVLHKHAAQVLSPYINIAECANEVSGSPGDDKWPGPLAYEKMQLALKVWLHAGKTRLVTLFLNNDDLIYSFEWCLKHPFQSEYVGMSNYQNQIVGGVSIPLQVVISQMAYRCPGARVLFSEYGCEDNTGLDNCTPEERASMILQFDGRSLIHPQDVGGNFYWDSYKWLVSQPDPLIIQAYQKAWGF